MKYIWQKKGWSNLTWRNEELAELLGKSRFAQGKLISKIESLGFDLNLEARTEILTEEAIKTAQIEGEKLSKLSVRSSVARQLGLSTAGLPPVDRHIDGLIEVLIDATANFNKGLTKKRLKGWQAALFPTGYSGMHLIRVGKWRGPEPMKVASGPIGRERIHFEAPPHKAVENEINKFLSWWKSSLSKTDGFIRAGIAHFYFVTIHPFEDGNGRIARAITDMALAQDENIPNRFYSLSHQIMIERKNYYDILEKSQRGSCDITEWLHWFLGCSERAIKNSEILISKILLKADFWKRYGQLNISDRQRKVINRLLDAGPGGFEGGLTTRKYVSIAKVSRATAYREITDLTEKEMLKQNDAGGRSISYNINWPN
jgi:Fic family protein